MNEGRQCLMGLILICERIHLPSIYGRLWSIDCWYKMTIFPRRCGSKKQYENAYHAWVCKPCEGEPKLNRKCRWGHLSRKYAALFSAAQWEFGIQPVPNEDTSCFVLADNRVFAGLRLKVGRDIWFHRLLPYPPQPADTVAKATPPSVMRIQ
jgi:hypothetical protein